MSIKLLREGIRTWLTRLTRVDVWDLDVPRNSPTVIDGKIYPANCAIEMPIKDFGVQRFEGYTEGKGNFIYALLYRYSGKAAMHQLPVKSVENLINYLAEYAVNRPQSLYVDIRSLEISSIANPVGIGRVEGEDQDWLIIGRLEMDIRYISSALESPELGLQPPPVVVPPLQITQVQTGLYRATHPVNPADDSTFIKDCDLSFPVDFE